MACAEISLLHPTFKNEYYQEIYEYEQEEDYEEKG